MRSFKKAGTAWRASLQTHWPEYGIEGLCLGLFMMSACLFGTLITLPDSPWSGVLSGPVVQRFWMGIAMGLTAVALIYSRMGKRSGAHMNPATTITFLRLGKIAPWDAFFYVLAQFLGGVTGVLLSRLLLGPALADAPVRYVVTVPGPGGLIPAFLAELVISYLLMATVLYLSNSPRLNRHTGLAAGTLVMVFIWFEAPLSGMSMNPARTLGSALPALTWTGLWIYFLAPTVGMLIASELFRRRRGPRSVLCAKLHHENDEPCIFRCNYPGSRSTKAS